MSFSPATRDPASGLDYSQVTSGGDVSEQRGLLAVVFGLFGYFLLVPLGVQLLNALGWIFSGCPGEFAEFHRAAVAFELPWGLVAAHIGLALLIPLSVAVTALLMGRGRKWVASVQPGFRWRYLVVCLMVAALVLNAFVVPRQLAAGWNPSVQENVWLWLGLVVLTSPLQAAAEEFFFRGLLLQSLGQASGRAWVGVVVSALVFAIMHGVQNPALFCNRFGFGLLAGLLVIRTGGLEASIACHVANNLFAFGWAAFFGGIANIRATQAISWTNAALDLASFAVFVALALWIAGRMRVATVTPEQS